MFFHEILILLFYLDKTVFFIIHFLHAIRQAVFQSQG